MTPLQKTTLRASEIRARLSELGSIVEQTDETRGEIETLRTEYQNIETRSQALMIAGDEPVAIETRSEDKELSGILDKASIGELFDGVLEHRSADGAMKELQTHYGLGDNQIPLDCLQTRSDGMELETRAVSPAPGDVGQNQNQILPYVFPQACASFLGIPQPRVGVGEAVYPVLTSELDVGTPAENAAQAETTGAFSADVLSPSRLQASFFYSREDRARFRNMDMSLRMNLSDGLASGLDKQIIAGTNGLLTGTNLAHNNVNSVTNFASYLSEYAYSRVDGRYANMTSQVRIVMGSGAYTHAASVYRNNSVDRNALDRLMEVTGGVKVSGHVPDVASNKQNAIIRLGMRRDMISCLWEGISLIPDEITLANKGQVQITAIMLYAVKILRKAGFRKQQSQHA